MSEELTAAALRHVFGHFPTGVTVVAAHDDGGPVGMACNSFASVSLEPPMVSFAVGARSDTWPRIEATGRCAINILSARQRELGHRFSRKGIDRFADVGWTLSPLGSPILDDSLAWLDCVLENVHPAGDHHLLLARVDSLRAATRGHPLIFYRGTFHGLERRRHWTRR